MAKGEIAHYEQFLLLSQCFQKSSAEEVSEIDYMMERIKIRFSSDSAPMYIWRFLCHNVVPGRLLKRHQKAFICGKGLRSAYHMTRRLCT